MIVTFIPAAGQSTRMQGRDKLLETIKGTPILKRTALAALAANLGPVIVGLRPDDKHRRKTLGNLPVTILEVPDADEGMAATLRAGAIAASAEISNAHDTADDCEFSGMMILLPDMPEIETTDLLNMNNAFQNAGGSPLRATDANGDHGHPTLFPDHMLGDFARLKGDKGAASLLTGEQVCKVPIAGARRDLDTPEDWAAWRKETKTPM